MSTGSLEGTTRLNKMKTTFSHILLQSCHQPIENGLTKRLNTDNLMFIPKIKMLQSFLDLMTSRKQTIRSPALFKSDARMTLIRITLSSYNDRILLEKV